MVELEDCIEAINKLQRDLHSSIVDKMSQEDLLRMAKDWQGQFKYWALNDFEKIIDHIVKHNRYFPKPSEFWALKSEIIIEKKAERLIAFDCGYCKDTGIRAYKDKGNIIHACRCDCGTGLKHYKHLPLISEIKKQGLNEFKIHDNQNPFALVPQIESMRLAQEIAGKNVLMLNILFNAEKNRTKNLDGLAKPLFEDKAKENYDEELPF